MEEVIHLQRGEIDFDLEHSLEFTYLFITCLFFIFQGW